MFSGNGEGSGDLACSWEWSWDLVFMHHPHTHLHSSWEQVIFSLMWRPHLGQLYLMWPLLTLLSLVRVFVDCLLLGFRFLCLLILSGSSYWAFPFPVRGTTWLLRVEGSSDALCHNADFFVVFSFGLWVIPSDVWGHSCLSVTGPLTALLDTGQWGHAIGTGMRIPHIPLWILPN